MIRLIFIYTLIFIAGCFLIPAGIMINIGRKLVRFIERFKNEK